MSDQVLPRLVSRLLERALTVDTRASWPAARRCVADAIACAAAGSRSPGYGRISEAMGNVLGGGADATVWFTGRVGSVAEATYVNATAVAADDLDDGNRSAVGHPGGAIVPSVVAHAQSIGYEGNLLPAVVVGYEAAIAVASGRQMAQVPTMATGRWAAYGVAAALAFLTTCSEGLTTASMAHAGSLSPQLVHPHPSSPDGLKEGTAWAALAGLTGFRLALAGVDAPTHVLDAHPDHRPGWFDGLGPTPAVDQTYFKQYACCRWIHPVLDLVFGLRERGLLPEPGAVREVRVRTFARSLTLPNDAHPTSIEAAHYSFPFCVALALCGSRSDFLPLRSDSLDDARVRELAARVHVVEDPALTSSFPGSTPAAVVIETADGQLCVDAPTAVGDPALPLSDQLMARKHATLLADRPYVCRELESVRTGSGPLSLNDLRMTLCPSEKEHP